MVMGLNMNLFNRKRRDFQDKDPEINVEEMTGSGIAILDSELPAPSLEIPDKVVLVEAENRDRNRNRDRELFRSLLSGLYDGILIVDSKGIILESNQRARDFFEYDEVDLWNVNCSQLIPQINQKVLFKVQTHVTEGRFSVVNATCLRADGSRFPAEIAVGMIHFMDDNNLIFSIRNCERRNRARAQRQFRDNALLRAAVGIAACTSNGIIEYANPAFLRMLMADKDKEVLQRRITHYCKDAKTGEELVKSPSQGGVWYGRLELKTLHGTFRHVQVTSALTDGEDSKRGDKPMLVVSMMLIPKGAISI